MENHTTYYIPRDIQIGKGKVRNPSVTTKSINEIAIPSCKLKMKCWTDMDLFETISGFRPTNMVDKVKEIEKTVTGNVFGITNEPTNGFRIKSCSKHSAYMNYSYYYSNGYVILEDPRGFNIEIDSMEFITMILNNKIPISSDGIIDAKLIYVWKISESDNSKSDGWSLTTQDSSILESKITQEDIEKEMVVNPGIKLKDMVPNTVYDYELDNSGKPTRVLFLGKMKILNMNNVSKFISHQFINNFNYICNSAVKYPNMGSYCQKPWESEIWKNIINALPEIKERYLFVVLEKRYSYTHKYDMDNFINGKTSNKPYCRISLVKNVRCDIGGGKKVRGISKDQTIHLDFSEMENLDQCYSIDEVKESVNNFNDRILRLYDKIKTVFPTNKIFLDEWHSLLKNVKFTDEEKMLLN